MAPEEVSAIASHAIEVQEAEEVLLAKIADGACLPDLTGSSKLIEEVNARG